MDVGAISLGKGTDRTAESSGTRSTTSSDATVQGITNNLQEVATSRLSSLLSSLAAEPLAAAPRMPQQHTLRSTNVGEKASLPQPLATPSFPVPPHLMGRNVNNPVEDIVSHGRRLQKPRLGVKVPYRNLTSQIVTQDELAQELLERSLKKHPVRNVPEGGDLFFAIKLTQRLANRLSPSGAQVSVASRAAVRTTQQQSPEVNRTIPLKHPSTATSPAIADHRDLLAILEGDGDPDWSPASVAAATPQTSVATVVHEHVPPPPISHITNVKLDPLLEKELALKQLMEFQNNSRRRKSNKAQKPDEKMKRQRSQGKKEPLNKENGTVGLKGNAQNTTKSNVLNSSGSASGTPVVIKGRKRKNEESPVGEVKKPRISGKKSVVQSKSDSKANVIKTEEKSPKKLKNSKNASPSSINNNNNNNTERNVGTNAVAKGKGAAASAKDTKAVSDSKPKKSISPATSGKTQVGDGRKKTASPLEGSNVRTSNRGSNASVSKSDSLNESQDTQSSSLIDDFPEFPRSFTTPIRTYSPKKRTPNANASPNLQTPEMLSTNNNVESVKPESSPVKPKATDTKVPEPSPPPKQSPENSEKAAQKKKESKENVKRRKGEVDRLLMDEGAINLLYEAEHGDSRRRSSAPEENVVVPPQRRILKSVRRKKKDLLLKTRLVKNAVLRLSNSSSSGISPMVSRITRRTEAPNQQSTSADQGSNQQRKLSLDSRESLRSPPPLTPEDPSSQSFVYPVRLPLPAEASRIIRRHSSSSNFSSRSASPSTNRNIDLQGAENAEKSLDTKRTLTNSGNVSKSSGSISSGRKKGVPIFIRKPQVIQTYQGKKKKIPLQDQKSSIVNVPVKQSNKATQQNNKDAKITSKGSSVSMLKTVSEKKKAAVKKISISDKLKLKMEMSKNFSKGFQSGKVKQSVKKLAENGSAKSKKKEEVTKDTTSKSATAGTSGNANGSIVDEMLDLTSCLAAAASAFAAEAREEKSSKKTASSSGTSHSSSPCPSRSSKSPTPTNRTTGKKGIAPPLSPNAATYSNLLKTLENESQKQRKKDGEEVTKQRSSVRQNAGAYHYKDISLRRYDNLVQVILTPQSTKMKNALNLQVLRELKDALSHLKKDETCRAVLLTSTGSSFCQGIDFYGLLHTNAERRKSAAQELAQALKEFMKSLALFSKPIVAGVHGAAVGLGVTMLPFFDMVFASDKATFYTPYAKLGQVPEGAAILTLPHMFGNAVTSELLFGCRKLTASEALHFGLVTRILWPDRFQEELIPVIRSMATQSAQVRSSDL
ncbi:hypothetical protein R5R35_002389 [Gryllus longicercus]|uniref:Uncharacterized protein n=1 Tax=Gryllus longicercus TaxID=2509291 RepID=A0AAN9Z1A6_9ORTH